MNLLDYPGNLGPTRGTLITVHHADWPAYPQGENFRTPLLQLTAFPAGTEFRVLDHVDQSTLFAACVQGAKLAQPFAARNFHVAIWYKDLIELNKRGFLEGVRRASEREWEQDRWQRLLARIPAGAQMGYVVAGEFIRIETPDFEAYDDDSARGKFVLCPSDCITIRPAGRDFVLQELGAIQADIMAALDTRVVDLFERGYHDTCIREACVQLEHEIRLRTGAEAFGDRLVEVFVETVRAQQRYLESYVRSFRQELRAVFKFIRNDFMHNLRAADRAATLAMLFRIVSVRALLQTPPPAAGHGSEDRG